MKTIWDFWAKHYENLWVQKYSLEPTRRKVLHILRILQAQEALPAGSCLLDLGCGTGQLLQDIDRTFKGRYRLLGVDISEEMLKRARQKKGWKGECRFYRAEAADIRRFAKEKPLFISCTHSLPYYGNGDRQAKAIQDMAATLGEEGHLVIACASVNSLFDRLALLLVKATTGGARYPSLRELKSFAGKTLSLQQVYRIRERFFMPCILVLVYRKKKALKKVQG